MLQFVFVIYQCATIAYLLFVNLCLYFLVNIIVIVNSVAHTHMYLSKALLFAH
jgi:hypothetical protein